MQIIKPLSGPKFLGAVFVFVRNVEFISKQPCQFFVFTFFITQVQIQCSSLYTFLLTCIPSPSISLFSYFRLFALAGAERGRGNLGAQEPEGCANFPFPFPIGIRAQSPSHGPLCFITSPSLSPVCEKRAQEEEAVSASLPSLSLIHI